MKKRLLDKLFKKDFKDSKILEIRMSRMGTEPINDDSEKAFRVIRHMHAKFLKNDPNWHYFYEDVYNIIRFSEEFLADVIEIMDSYNIMYEEKGEWEDEQEGTEQYQDIFKEMFHSFSEMAIRCEGVGIDLILDRVIHCFLNHQFLPLQATGQIKDDLWESDLVACYLNKRSWYAGWCRGINQERDRWKGAK